MHAELLSAVKGTDFFNADAILRQKTQDIISIVDAVDEHGNAALHYAAGNRNILMVDLLLKNGAAINIEDVNGNRPLHRAVESGGVDVAEYLLRKGADINAVNKMGNTALHEVASKVGDVKMVTVLLKSNPDLTANHDGLTPEDIAATAECKEMIAGYREWYVTDCNTKFNAVLSTPMSSIKTASPSTRKVTFMDELTIHSVPS
jgi:ankyrin repeat protein